MPLRLPSHQVSSSRRPDRKECEPVYRQLPWVAWLHDRGRVVWYRDAEMWKREDLESGECGGARLGLYGLSGVVVVDDVDDCDVAKLRF